MGQRISYFKNNFRQDLKELLFSNFFAFKEWYLSEDKSSLAEFNEPFANQNIKDYLLKDSDLKDDFEKLDKKLVDELTPEFIVCYHNMTDTTGQILEFFGPTMSAWRYVDSTKLVAKTQDSEFIKLWSYITVGRSLKNDNEFTGYTNDYKIGFLEQDEWINLKNLIETYFGNLDSIQEKYWTKSEKKQLQKAIDNSKNGLYSLSGHNPISSGLEYVLQALNELDDNNKELITGIE